MKKKYLQEINLTDEQIQNHILNHSNPFYTEYPGQGHNVWTESYDNGMNYESFDSYKIPQKQF